MLAPVADLFAQVFAIAEPQIAAARGDLERTVRGVHEQDATAILRREIHSRFAELGRSDAAALADVLGVIPPAKREVLLHVGALCNVLAANDLLDVVFPRLPAT
jgi:hypothetical protein